MVPLFRSSFLVAVFALSCFRGASADFDETTETIKNSFLRHKSPNDGFGRSTRILPGRQEEVCPPGEMLYYNAFFTLEDREGDVTYKCETDDEEKMGKAIRDIVKSVDENFPKFQDSSVLNSISTTVCIFPSFAEGTVQLEAVDGDHRNLAELTPEQIKKRNRRRKRFLFSSGGRCRMCKKEQERSLLAAAGTNSDGRILKKEELDMDAMAKEACEMAVLSNTILSVGQKGLDSISGYVADIDTRVGALEHPEKVFKKEKIMEANEMVRKSASQVVKTMERATEGKRMLKWHVLRPKIMQWTEMKN